MKLKLLAAILAASALPVLAQTTTTPAQPSQARVEVDHGDSAAPKSAQANKAQKQSHKKSTKKKSKKHTQTAG